MRNRFACLIGCALVGSWLNSTVSAAVIETKAGSQTGEVARVDKDNVWVKTQFGESPIPKTDIISIDIPRAAAYDQAVKLLNEKKYKEAAAALKAVVDVYGGLDIEWIQSAVLELGDAYAGANDLLNAKRTLDAFKAMYPKSPRLVELDAKYNRILVGQKKYPEAKAALEKSLKPLLEKVSITEPEENAAAESLVLLGDCQKALNELEQALDSYLLTVSLFDVSASRTAEAKFKAAQIFEELKKWERAKGSYKELASTEYAAEAKQRLAALEQAHP